VFQARNIADSYVLARDSVQKCARKSIKKLINKIFYLKKTAP
jgi:hypothetical protein